MVIVLDMLYEKSPSFIFEDMSTTILFRVSADSFRIYICGMQLTN